MNDEHLEDLITYLKFPSISTDSSYSKDVKDCAEWLTNKMIDKGLEAQIHETPGHPIVIGKNEHREGLPTIMI